MTVTWPNTLPQCFLADSLALEQPQNVILSEMSIGPEKARRRSTSGVRSMSGTLSMTASEYVVFVDFVSSTILDGVRPFLFPQQEPPFGSAILVRLKPPYKVSRVGNRWRVSLEMQILP